MNKPLTLLIDMDNVLADQVQGFISILTKHYPEIQIPDRDALREFDFEKNFPVEHRETILSIRHREGFFRDLEPIEGAKQGLKRLAGLDTELHIVTAPIWEWRHCVGEKYAWIEKHLGREWAGKTILTRDKTLVRGDLLIDDAPTVSGSMAPSWMQVLYDQPHNRHIVENPRVAWDTMDLFIDAWIKVQSSKVPKQP